LTAGPTSGFPRWVDTIAQLKGQIGAGNELYFILGWDNLEDLPRWKEPARLISLCRLVAVPRAGSPVPDPAALEEAVPGLSERLIMLDKPEIDISASVIRQRVSQGLSIEHRAFHRALGAGGGGRVYRRAGALPGEALAA